MAKPALWIVTEKTPTKFAMSNARRNATTAEGWAYLNGAGNSGASVISWRGDIAFDLVEGSQLGLGAGFHHQRQPSLGQLRDELKDCSHYHFIGRFAVAWDASNKCMVRIVALPSWSLATITAALPVARLCRLVNSR